MYQLKHDLMEAKKGVAQVEGQWRFFADCGNEMSSSDDQENNHDKYLKRRLLIELKQPLVNKVLFLRDSSGTNIRELREQ